MSTMHHIYRKLFILFTASMVLFSLSFLDARHAAATTFPDNFTIYTTKAGYQSAKFEPRQGTYLGAYVLQDEYINADMNVFNEMTGKKHASFFIYVGYGQPFPTKWVEEVKAAGAVPHIAFEPNNGLDKVKDDEYLRKWAQDAKAADVPIFLRYASEMNGTWTEYSGNPELFIEKWKLVHKVMAEEAPNVAMVWTVFTFPDDTITSFYPGDAYVDWVGVNVYNVVYHNNRIEDRADHEDPIKLIEYVYNTYSHKKPIQISEYGATHYTITDESYHVSFAVNKIKRLYENLPTIYPRIKSIYYFDVNNLLNAPEGRKINDYSLTNDPQVLNAYKQSIKSDKYLTEVKPTKPAKFDEKLSFHGFQFQYRSKLYVDVSFFRDYLGMNLTINKNKATLTKGSRTHTFNIVSRKVSKGYNNDYYTVQGLPLRDVAAKFNYVVHLDETKEMITVYPKP